MSMLPQLREQIVDAAARNATAPRPRRLRLDWLLPSISIAAATAVAVVFLSTGHRRSEHSPMSATGTPGIILRAEPSAQVPRINAAVMARAAEAVRLEVAQLRVPGAVVRTRGRHELAVTLPRGVPAAALAAQLVHPPRLAVYDWEADTLLPGGRTVATALLSGNRSAIAISQGAGTGAPGSVGGSSLYQAVQLAAQQPKTASPNTGRAGDAYYVFARCPTGHCLVTGPLPTRPRAPRTDQVLVVKPGTVVLQATPRAGTPARAPSAPPASYFVLRDRPALLGDELTHPRPATDTSGQPDVQFDFTSHGAAAFHTLTQRIAQRGELVSSTNQPLDQHFAIALGNQLLTVPAIDYRQYPDGISTHSADIIGSFTPRAATQLSDLLLVPHLTVVKP